jgi:hypothetical protein
MADTRAGPAGDQLPVSIVNLAPAESTEDGEICRRGRIHGAAPRLTAVHKTGTIGVAFMFVAA